MKQLSALDAAFLSLETPTTPMHTMAMLLLEGGEPEISVETLRSLMMQRMHLLPVLGQRLIELPFGFDRPVLVDDARFDVREHVTEVREDQVRSLAELDLTAGYLASRPLDRSRPLWRVWFFPGLPGNTSALLFKVHHAIVDGVSAANFMAQLLDTDPRARVTLSTPHLRVVDAHPSKRSLALRALWNTTKQPFESARAAVGVADGLRALWSETPQDGDPSFRWPVPRAPRTALGGALSSEREIARDSVELDSLRFIKKAFDTTVNDALLAACTLALRQRLMSRGEAPRQPLVASVPVSIRESDADPGGNRISTMLVRLPVHLSRPDVIIRVIRRDTLAAKRTLEVLGSRLRVPALDAVSPFAVRWLGRQYARFGLTNLIPPMCNIVVSNITGPPVPLYCAGVRVRAAYPFGPLPSGTGLNLTAMSYGGRMDLGLIVCPKRVPDSGELVDNLVCAVAELQESAERLARPSLRRCAPRTPVGVEFGERSQEPFAPETTTTPAQPTRTKKTRTTRRSDSNVRAL